jgi:hypothetical protein
MAYRKDNMQDQVETRHDQVESEAEPAKAPAIPPEPLTPGYEKIHT